MVLLGFLCRHRKACFSLVIPITCHLSDRADVSCVVLQACIGTGSNSCPLVSGVTSTNFKVINCTSGTATVNFTSPFFNGVCTAKSISWVTVAALDPSNGTLLTCLKGYGQYSLIGEAVSLEEVPCGSRIVVYAHDGSFKNGAADVLFLPSICRDSSDKNHCGPYGELILDCSTCTVAKQAHRRFHRYKLY